MMSSVSPVAAGRSPPSTWLRKVTSATVEHRAGGGPAGAYGTLHVAGDPLVGAADVERRLVRAVQRADRGHVAGGPLGDVALRPRVAPPHPPPERARPAGLGAVEARDLPQDLVLAEVGRDAGEHAEALGWDEGGQDRMGL